jgi:hypothetical protein
MARIGVQANCLMDKDIHQELLDKFPGLTTSQALRYLVAISLDRSESDAMKIAMRKMGRPRL